METMTEKSTGANEDSADEAMPSYGDLTDNGNDSDYRSDTEDNRLLKVWPKEDQEWEDSNGKKGQHDLCLEETQMQDSPSITKI